MTAGHTSEEYIWIYDLLFLSEKILLIFFMIAHFPVHLKIQNKMREKRERGREKQRERLPTGCFVSTPSVNR